MLPTALARLLTTKIAEHLLLLRRVHRTHSSKDGPRRRISEMKFEVFVARCRLQVVSLHMSATFHSLTAVLRQEAAYLALAVTLSRKW